MLCEAEHGGIRDAVASGESERRLLMLTRLQPVDQRLDCERLRYATRHEIGLVVARDHYQSIVGRPVGAGDVGSNERLTMRIRPLSPGSYDMLKAWVDGNFLSSRQPRPSPLNGLYRGGIAEVETATAFEHYDWYSAAAPGNRQASTLRATSSAPRPVAKITR